MAIWAIIPVKSLQHTKSRLTAVLSASERAHLTSHLLTRLLIILDNTPEVAQIIVVSRDETIGRVARQHNAIPLVESPEAKLNAAVHTGVNFAAAQGARQLLILPSDLPFLTRDDVAVVCAPLPSTSPSLIICPDRHQRGTNALCLPSDCSFQFQFGPDSFQQHLQEARRGRLTPHIIHTPGWQFDLDTVEDWAIYAQANIHNP
ncbi:MAG: 2-phospho-L-lactate guanylyltransferase [Chloroflexi bacterium]|nr:2-phospho-L-lactate guanylyltransferase [Chloroflexota bacterium]